MDVLILRGVHRRLGARFTRVNGAEAVSDYGDWVAEHAALRQTAGVLDLSFRSRLCLTGGGRLRFLHGQVTNEIKKLRPGTGTYAAIVTTRGTLKGDVNIFSLPEKLLLDLEPGLARPIARRLKQHLLTDDVRIADAAPDYGLLSVQGPRAAAVLRSLRLPCEVPLQPMACVKVADPQLGKLYVVNHARLLNVLTVSPYVVFCKCGFDLFVPNAALEEVADRLIAVASREGGRACGWQAFEAVRVETGIPRFGVDMDETNNPMECGMEVRAIAYTKGAYIGQERIQRLHNRGGVTQNLRGLWLADDLALLPRRGDPLFRAGQAAGYVTSAVRSPLLQANIALGYVRRLDGEPSGELTLKTAAGESPVKVVELPFNVDFV